MKKVIVFLFYLLVVKTVLAINVATVTDFGDGTIIKDCVAINSGESVYNVYKTLDKNRDDITIDFDGDKIPPINPYINSINDLGQKTEGTKFYGWNFWVTNEANNDFTEPPELAPGWGMGIGDYKISSSGEVIGVGYGFTEFNDDWTIKTPPTAPAFESYESICEKLIIDEVTAYVDGDKDKLGEGDKIRDVKPESKLKLKIKVKNLYEEDIEIKDITITAIIKDIDDGDDLEEESDEFDLDAGDSKTETIEFEIPLEVEDGIYDLILEIEGKDDQDVEYSKTYEYSIEVEKEKHEVMISRAELSSSSLKCSRTTTLDVSVINMGTNEEDVVLKVINADLGLNKQLNFELSDDPFDDDSKYSTSFTITVDNDQEAGVYPITISADYGSKTVEETVELIVEDCKIKEEEEKEDVIVNIEQEEQESISSEEIPNVVEEVKSDETKKIKNILMISSAVLVYIVIVVGGVALVVKVGKG